MTTRLKVESVIRELPAVEVCDPTSLQDILEEKWDRQIEDDIKSGELDHIITKIELDITLLKLFKTYKLPISYHSFGA